MKRGNVSSRESKHAAAPVIIRVSVDGATPEPMRVRHRSMEPKVGEFFHAHPTRFRKAVFAKNFLVVRIEKVEGVEIFHVEHAVMGAK